MKRNDPTFQVMVARINSGELTRAQAADTYNLNLGTLHVWLSRSGVKTPRQKVLHGAALDWVIDDPERTKAIQAAVTDVTAGRMTARAAAQAHGQAFATVAWHVRKILASQGIRRPTGRPPKEPKEPKEPTTNTPAKMGRGDSKAPPQAAAPTLSVRNPPKTVLTSWG